MINGPRLLSYFDLIKTWLLKDIVFIHCIEGSLLHTKKFDFDIISQKCICQFCSDYFDLIVDTRDMVFLIFIFLREKL
jgi:hypothetical protein